MTVTIEIPEGEYCYDLKRHENYCPFAKSRDEEHGHCTFPFEEFEDDFFQQFLKYDDEYEEDDYEDDDVDW